MSLSEFGKKMFEVLVAVALGLGGWALKETIGLNSKTAVLERDQQHLFTWLEKMDTKLDKLLNKK